MGVERIDLPQPVQTTKDRIRLQEGYSGGNIAVYGKNSKVLGETESTRVYQELDQKYRQMQKEQGLKETGFTFLSEGVSDATCPQVIQGEDGNTYISLQTAPELPRCVDGEIKTERRANGTLIVAVDKDGKLLSKKAYLKANLDALENGKLPEDPDSGQGYLVAYTTVDKDGKPTNHIKNKNPVNPDAIANDPKIIRQSIDENLIDTRQLPKDGSPLVIGKDLPKAHKTQ